MEPKANEVTDKGLFTLCSEPLVRMTRLQFPHNRLSRHAVNCDEKLTLGEARAATQELQQNAEGGELSWGDGQRRLQLARLNRLRAR